MGRINIGKIVSGGVLAGILIFISQAILNLWVLGNIWDSVMQVYGIPEPPSSIFVLYALMSIILGILAVWVYAAIRPRFGPGARTAMIAGIAVWALYYGMGAMRDMTAGIWPLSAILIGVFWGLLEMILVTTLGARFYTEPAAPST
ncbi:MAG: hypothetical protein L0271_02435 [Gemmatimonadetes bacterium]|nr:hypothetical protein [Gemmatimonadota bacterium]